MSGKSQRRQKKCQQKTRLKREILSAVYRIQLNNVATGCMFIQMKPNYGAG